MARLEDRLPENAPGDWFVDRTCIDCDLCRQIAPAVFGRADGAEQSFVHCQPANEADRRRAALALVACPTSSIGTGDKRGLQEAARAFPERIEPPADAPPGSSSSGEAVYFCGYASEASYGASSYLIRRPDGNVLVDSPRAARPLLRRLAELGGIRWMVLSHRDDVADHEIFAREFGCERVMHERDIDRGTRGVEVKVSGDAPAPIAHDLLVIPVPGHTRGSMALLYRAKYLFSGDHLWRSGSSGRLHASRGVCWYSWAEQTRSMERLLRHRFEWVLPGHGRRWRAPSAEVMRAEIEALIGRMRAAA
jgi:glyoxylase-like metal-dependent hydrolase (beta-lactamase superfamily II)/ferredoxin